MEENRAKALVHLRFVFELYLKQMTRGCYFLHEYPGSADSWTEPCVQEVWAKKGVRRVVADQCMYGQQNQHGELVRKPTGFLTNSNEIAVCLERKCKGVGEHAADQPEAATYPA